MWFRGFSVFPQEVTGATKAADYVRDSGDRLLPVPRVAGCPVPLDAFLCEQNLSLNPAAPREPTTFQSLSASRIVASDACADAMLL